MTPEGEGKEYGARSEKREARSEKREVEARSTPEALSALRYPQIEVEIRKVELKWTHEWNLNQKFGQLTDVLEIYRSIRMLGL